MIQRKKITLMTAAPLKEIKESQGLTPMLEQYMSEKAKHPECLLFFWLGDFYELFFEDALVASKALQITLTHRGFYQNKPIPMCGVPFHAAENYLKKLIQQGFRIAICEQTETPEDRLKKGGSVHSKVPLRREVVRIITPGTVVEDAFLESSAHNFLLSVALHPKTESLSCALLDLSTQTLMLEQVSFSEFLSLLSRYTVAELLIPESLFQHYFDELRPYHKCTTALSPLKYDRENAKARLYKIYDLLTFEGLGDFSDTDMTALGVLVDYLEVTQKEALAHLPFPKKQNPSTFLILDHYTRMNLEIDRSTRGTFEGSLRHTLDITQTSGGSRLLQQRLSCPLQESDELNHRLESISFFIHEPCLKENLRDSLNNKNDMERSLSRIMMGKGGPHDLGHILKGLETAKNIIFSLKDYKNCPFALPIIPDILLETLGSALDETLPILARDGGFIKHHFNKDLDALRALQSNTEQHMEGLQSRYIEETGISTLKIKQNNILGYFLECPPSQQSKIPLTFIHRQSLASALRYTTPELQSLADHIASAATEALSLELQIFQHLCERVSQHQQQLQTIAHFLATIDLSTAMAHLAMEKNYTRPVLSHEKILMIDDGRHPVLDTQQFTPNSTHFNADDSFFLITGPNMAGKSTYLRQNALITLMAQCGFFVPAKRAIIGITDRIFSRIGAGDDLASGRSTFMVEMVETATILNQATEKSLVILDELGRGTSTYDGLSLAKAVTEHLATVTQCRTLFATHYFELTDLEQNLPSFKNLQMGIKEYDGKILFLHTVQPGFASRSYGLHVAALAGIPSKIITRAEEILLELQTPPPHIKDERHTTQLVLPLHTCGPKDTAVHRFLEDLKALDIHNLTPMKALTFLSEIKEKLLKNY